MNNKLLLLILLIPTFLFGEKCRVVDSETKYKTAWGNCGEVKNEVKYMNDLGIGAMVMEHKSWYGRKWKTKSVNPSKITGIWADKPEEDDPSLNPSVDHSKYSVQI